MARPRKCKTVEFQPSVTYFKPSGVPMTELVEIVLSIEECEALRLSDLEDMNQTDAAKKMGCHQSSFQRTLTKAREKITDALINGKAIRIDDGEIEFKKE